MKLYLSRDCVHASDNGDERTLVLPDRSTLDQALAAVLVARYLPSISGGKATWSVTSNLPLAVIAEQWELPRVLFLTDAQVRALDWHGDTLRLQFNYHAQEDPDQVLRILRNLRMRAG